jgi:hypothetical protein
MAFDYPFGIFKTSIKRTHVEEKMYSIHGWILPKTMKSAFTGIKE